VKKLFPLILLFCIAFEALAQKGLPKFWISFTDKNSTSYSIDRPEEFLSARSIERRTDQGIAIVEEDLPVNLEYLNLIKSRGISIINVSKWFNGAIIELDDTSYLDTLRSLDFVKSKIIRIKPRITESIEKSEDPKFKTNISPIPARYGFSYNQISMLNGDVLHEQGYSGEGMLIAVLDAGFTNANILSSLRHIWDENRVIAWKDFVKDGRDIFDSHYHGSLVFSIMGGFQPEMLIGTAPNAQYILVRTEETPSEYLIEEYNWVCGAEFADSLGADVINTSLGYTEFDDSTQNHTYSDMDGRTAPISIAATHAARKGMIVTTSAGNSGNNSWFRIGTPADADSILAIGAVDSLGIIAGFSSRGPAYDGRVKPDVAAQGFLTIAQHPSGNIVYCSGTSCSSPVVAGLTACLWQANPNSTNIEVIEAIRKSASQYFNPDSAYGYGIPDMIKADWLLRSPAEFEDDSFISFTLFPNPAADYFYLRVFRPEETNNEEVTLNIYDLLGRLQRQDILQISGQQFMLDIRDISNLATGIYILEIRLSGRIYNLLFSKR